jgi:hypothetical protein
MISHHVKRILVFKNLVTGLRVKHMGFSVTYREVLKRYWGKGKERD